MRTTSWKNRTRRIAVTALVCGGMAAVVPFIVRATETWSGATSIQPTLRIPSNVGWTDETIKAASQGDPVRGLLVARRCESCHGVEGFSASATIPDLAGLDRLSIWKQLQDFKSGKRESSIMEAMAAPLSERDFADLAAYYSELPAAADPQDRRTFPEARPEAAMIAVAGRLVTFGDPRRDIPACQACHGPGGRTNGAPALNTQNGTYLLDQLNAYADGSRRNDINMVMRTIAHQMTESEREAVARFYGSGAGL